MIHQLKEQGLSISAIAERTGRDRKTVRKYLNDGLDKPTYGPRQPRPRRIDPFAEYIRERLTKVPQLSAVRLLREIRELGYTGGRTMLTDFVRPLRPRTDEGFEHRFETAPGEQAQVDFAQFKVVFTDEPHRIQVVWLFSLVLGYSRYLFGRFVSRQNLDSVVRCHLEAFAEIGAVPRVVLYDRMKTAVLGQDDEGELHYHPTLLDLASHFAFRPRACAPYRAKTKGKVERPFRYVREDFFLGENFANLTELNQRFEHWRAHIANQRQHGTTGRFIHEAFADELGALQPLPAHPYQTVLRLERKLTRDGMISLDGNLYSVPDGVKRRIVEVHRLAQEIRIYDGDTCLAVHPVLEGRARRSLLDGHRSWPPPGHGVAPPGATKLPKLEPLTRAGENVSQRSLDVYAALGQALADANRPERSTITEGASA